MAYRGKVFVKGEFYHLFNRGVNRGKIFHSDANYAYCLRLMRKYAARYQITLCSYCLMPNHFHLLVCQKSNDSISRFINATFNAYVQALNKQINRSGPLFEGRFRYLHVDRNEYLIHLCRYIHLNPVTAGLVVHPEDWPFSDYREAVADNVYMFTENNILSSSFDNPKEYKEFVTSHLAEKNLPDRFRTYIFD